MNNINIEELKKTREFVKKTLTNFRTANWEINIHHNRNHKLVFVKANGKIDISTISFTVSSGKATSLPPSDGGRPTFVELLPRGGITYVQFIDPVSGLEFSSSAICHEDDSYCKSIGVEICLNRIIDLMRATTEEGFICPDWAK